MRSSDCVCGSRLVAAHRWYSGATMHSLGDGLKDRGQDSQLAVPEDEGSLLRHTHRIFLL